MADEASKQVTPKAKGVRMGTGKPNKPKHEVTEGQGTRDLKKKKKGEPGAGYYEVKTAAGPITVIDNGDGDVNG